MAETWHSFYVRVESLSSKTCTIWMRPPIHLTWEVKVSTNWMSWILLPSMALQPTAVYQPPDEHILLYFHTESPFPGVKCKKSVISFMFFCTHHYLPLCFLHACISTFKTVPKAKILHCHICNLIISSKKFTHQKLANIFDYIELLFLLPDAIPSEELLNAVILVCCDCLTSEEVICSIL